MHVSTETGGGSLTSNFEFQDDDSFIYENITQYLILVEFKKVQITRQKSRERVSPSRKFPLRSSLFPHVPPYINFQLFNDASLTFPSEFAKWLEWEMTSWTPWIVQKTVKNTGYRLVRGSRNWCGSWSEFMYSYSFKFIKPFQKINHFPGLYEIGRKDKLWENIHKLALLHGKRAFDFLPNTFVLPNNLEELRVAWKSGESCKWILKPAASSRGRGIKLVSKWTQVSGERTNHVIVQRYLSKPKLIDGVKFDLRFYVLITSFDPLRIYLCTEGLVRFASKKYENNATTLDNHFIHLTNYSINKFCPQYTSNDDVDTCKGHKWSLKCLWTYLEKHQNINSAKLLQEIRDMIIKTVISSESSVNSFSRIYLPSKYNCYELLGVDILLDDNMKPWLLEVNISPSLQIPSPLDLAIKGPLVRDALNIACFQLPISKLSGYYSHPFTKSKHKKFLEWTSQDFRIHEKRLTEQEKWKQIKFSCQGAKGKCVKSILDDLTPDDVRHLLQYEDELTNLGCFQKIFPTEETEKYLKYFRKVSYYNLLLDAWEKQYFRKRDEGISRLQNLCWKKYHLRR